MDIWASDINVAIIGASGHIAKSLIHQFSSCDRCDLFLYGRSVERISEFISNMPHACDIKCGHIDQFGESNYDVVINCIGIGDPQQLSQSGNAIFGLTNFFDTLVLGYLQSHESTLYVNFSSGAAYGSDFEKPASLKKKSSFNINNIEPNDYYGISKLYSEVMHRSYKDYRIVDLRIFGYFSRFINLDTRYFMSDVVKAIKNHTPFITNGEDMVRDYIHPSDLFKLIGCCSIKAKINRPIDVYSLKPAAKFEILEFFKGRYDLEVIVNDGLHRSPTGNKSKYYSESSMAHDIGYEPSISSLDTLVIETDALLDS